MGKAYDFDSLRYKRRDNGNVEKAKLQPGDEMIWRQETNCFIFIRRPSETLEGQLLIESPYYGLDSKLYVELFELGKANESQINWLISLIALVTCLKVEVVEPGVRYRFH